MLKALPLLTSSQSWCCAEGCGDCKPKQIEFEFSRETAKDGSLIESKTTPIWVSDCCGGDLMLWDASLDEAIEVEASSA